MSVFIKLGAENAITTVYLCAIVHTVFDIVFTAKADEQKPGRNFNLYVTPAFEPLIMQIWKEYLGHIQQKLFVG